MRKIDYYVSGTTLRAHDAAILVGDDDPLATLVESAIQTISTDIRIKVGGVEMHLAAWQDPYHWEEDWLETHGLLPEEVHALVAGAVAVGEVS